jgi:exodeoxyribonuclease VIII
MSDETKSPPHELGRFENEPDTIYHSAFDFIGSSSLQAMQESPMHFLHAWTTPTEPTDPMERGTFIHRVTLEQDIADYVKRPVKEDGSLVRSNSKEYAEFMAKNEGKRFIPADLYDAAGPILNSVVNHRNFMDLFDVSDPEVSYYAKHPVTGQKIKARIDLLAKDRSFILDVKSTKDLSKFERQIFFENYDTRLIHYAEVIRSLEDVEINTFYFLGIESKAPFGCKLYRLSPFAVNHARDQWEQWMNVIAACVEDENFPGYSEEIFEVERPKFMSGVEAVTF